MSQKILMNDNWFYHEGDIEVKRPTVKTPVYAQSKTVRMGMGPASVGYRDDPYAWLSESGWDYATIPHDFIINQVPDKTQNNTLGYVKPVNAWYRKHFKIDSKNADKRITIYFEGIATKSTVYLNGCVLKRNFTAYTPFEIDITDYAKFGDEENVLAVYVSTDEYEGWWYQGGGIYRNVWLKISDKICVDLYGVYAKTSKIDDKNWSVSFETTVRNDNWDGRAKRITAVSSILDSQGKLVAKSEGNALVAPKNKNVIKSSAIVFDPDLWDIDNPVLYTVKTELLNSGRVCDTEEIRIGFRTIECNNEKGFFLNGKHVKIKGVCVHQDFGLTGIAVPDNIQHHKIKVIKSMGANGFRCSHYMNSEAVMDALDENGFITMAETRWFESSEDGINQLETLIKRDRNRPSVVFWSIGNEEPSFAREMGRKIGKTLYRKAKQLDDQRFVMCAVDNPLNCKVYDCLDVIGINYRLHTYDEIHKKFPDKAIFASEYSAAGTTRGHYFDGDDAHNFYSAYDENGLYINSPGRENSWKFFMDREWVMGGYQWTALEYRGETQWPCLCSQSGAVDLFMQKKDAYYQNLSHWSEKPMVHIMPHWNFTGLEGKDIKVWVYTNCEELELFLNGKSLGKQKIEKFSHGEWIVPFVEGELKADGFIKGKKVCRDIKKTTGKPVSLKLRLENNNAKRKGDILLFTCYAVDKNGNEVPDATDFINFYTNSQGTIVGTGSDITDHVPVCTPSRKMRMGLVSVAVRLNDKSDSELKLSAKGDNLGYAEIIVKL